MSPTVATSLDLKVIFTDLPKTAAALAAARTMAHGLGARITLMVARVVPYPLPLAEPDVPMEFTERMLESIAGEKDDADTTIEILSLPRPCRNYPPRTAPGFAGDRRRA